MKLYDLSWGPWTRRVTIYLKEKGIEDIEIIGLDYGDQRSPEMLRKNPLSYLPALELDDGSVLGDSLAIMEYLEEVYPEPNFIGRCAIERARMHAYLNVCNEFFVRALPIFANTLPQFARAVKQSPEAASWLRPFYDRSIASLEMLTDETGPFLMGERISMADCALYPMIHHNLENYEICTVSDEHPKLKRWSEMFALRDSAPCPLRDTACVSSRIIRHHHLASRIGGKPLKMALKEAGPMRLYELEWGIYPRRVLIYLAEKGIDSVEHIALDIVAGENRQAAFLALNPAGTVPILQVEANVIIRQSTSIIEYLEEKYPNPNMIGSTPESRAATRDMVSLVNEAYIYLLNYCGHASPLMTERITQSDAVATAMHDRYLNVLATIEVLAENSEFLTGDSPTFADCIFFASAQFADLLYGVALPEEYSKLIAFYSRFSKRASAKAPTYPDMIARLAPVPNRQS